MKKISLLLLLPSLALLGSCSSSDPEAVLNEAKEAVNQLAEPTVESYTLEVSGHITSFDQFEESSTYSVPSGEVSESGNSYMIRSPIRLKASGFYPENPKDPSIDLSQYSYSKITSRLLWSGDTVTTMSFEKVDDDLHFYVSGVSKNLIFYHVLTDQANNLYSQVQVYARYDISLVYNEEGLLIEETVKSQNPLSDEKAETVDIKTTYTYF